MRTDLEQTIKALSEPIANSMNVQILEMRIVPNSNRQEIRFVLDRVERPVIISDCTSFSRQLSRILDVEDPVDSAYTLQVSSPGFKRLIRVPVDLNRFVDCRIKVRLFEPVSGRSVWIGVLRNYVDPLLITVDETGDLEILFNNIKRINLHE